MSTTDNVNKKHVNKNNVKSNVASPTVKSANESAVTVVDLTDIKSIGEYVNNASVTFEERLKLISNTNVAPINHLCGALLDHATLSPKHVSPDAIIAGIYNLHITIANIITNIDNEKFKVGMDLINLAFYHFGNDREPFDAVMLLRYDDIWKWGDTSLVTHKMTTTIMHMLRDRSKRVKELEKVDFFAETLSKETLFTAEQLSRLSSYYH